MSAFRQGDDFAKREQHVAGPFDVSAAPLVRTPPTDVVWTALPVMG